ncbi:hypothetical protein YC2023_008264 [Brassica napus]
MASSTISSCGIEKIRKECYYERMSLQPNKRIVDLIEVIMFQRSNADDHHTRKLLSQHLLNMDENVEDGQDGDGSISDLTAMQLARINGHVDMNCLLKIPVGASVECISTWRLDVADMPMVIKVFSKDLVEAGEAVEEALDKNEEGMTVLMAEADKLRLDTIRTIVEVLTPVQVAALLLSLKRLHVSLHEWGRGREECCLVCAAARGGAGKSKRSATC